MADDMTRIAAWVQPQDILLGADVSDRRQALEVVAGVVGQRNGLDPAPIFRALWRREQAASTGLGNGFAIPHARISGISRPLTVFMRAKIALAFDAPDGKPVTDLLVIMVPAGGANDDHLQLLALVARLFSDNGFRAQLNRAQDPAAAAEAFRIGIAQATAEPSAGALKPDARTPGASG